MSFASAAFGYNHFPEVARAFKAAMSDIIAETTVDLGLTMAEQIAANGQIDTGFMWSSVYTVTKNGSTYGQNALTPPGDSYLLPEVTISGEMMGKAACAANYGEYQNYGTRFLPPRPFLEPSVDLVNVEFDAKVAALEGRMHV